jgi:Domain of unknown function (DUF397)
VAGSDFGDAVWRTSSYSGGNGDCVQVALTGWRTSSYSHGDGNCVEVAAARPVVGVRDSKDPAGPVLSYPARSWAAFLAGLRDESGRR